MSECFFLCVEPGDVPDRTFHQPEPCPELGNPHCFACCVEHQERGINEMFGTKAGKEASK